MHNNSNNPGKLLFLFSILLLLAGCSDTPKEPLVINDGSGNTQPFYSKAGKTQPLSYRKKHKIPLSSQHTVWDRMLSLYSLPEIENERIDRELSWYLRHPDYIARIQERAAPYMHLILNEIEAKNLPGELALLPSGGKRFYSGSLLT